MGGMGGGGISITSLKTLEERAKAALQASEATDSSPHVFLSFSHDDLDDVNLFRGQAKNDKLDLAFDDHSVKEPYDSANSEYIKGKIREKIERASVTAVYLSPDSAKSRWVNWEIEESIKQGKGVIGFYKGDKAPTSLPPAFKDGKFAIVPWKHDQLIAAIKSAKR